MTDPWVNYNTVGFTVSAPMQTYYLNNAELRDPERRFERDGPICTDGRGFGDAIRGQ